MAITKTNFINFTRCPRYAALDNIKKDRLDADITYEEYKKEEEQSKLNELIGQMYEIDENGEEIDLVDVIDRQLEAMLPYYNKIEELAGALFQKKFPGKTIYAKLTKNQENFSFNNHGIKYTCYVDVYNEHNDDINIVEVKATTSNAYYKLGGRLKGKDKYSIFKKIDGILYLKDEIPGYNIESEMSIKTYETQRNKLFDRFKMGKYIFDLAIQRFIIEGEYKESKNESKLKNIHYYLGILNNEYIFDGAYKDNEPIYNTDSNGNDIVLFIDLTKITGEWQPIVKEYSNMLEKYILKLDASRCPLGPFCEKGKPSMCKFFKPICGKIIPEKNSSLSYKMNGSGFVDDSGDRIKGLELINQGYIDMLDVPESWIKRKTHQIQRECYKNKSQYLNKEKTKDILKKLEYPIYHLDFETFPCPLPRFKGEWPYIQSPFEFSLHIEHSPGVCDKDKDNYVFLAHDHSDCREDMIKAMLKYMDPNKGTLFAQNVPFEKGRIKELATIFPKYKDDLMKLHARGFDLLWILDTNTAIYKDLGYEEEDAKVFNFYDYRQSGSYSIKKTLPIFTDLSYANLDVHNGTEAIVEYANYPNMDKEEFEFKYKALITYCKQDTWAMVDILNNLRKML